MTLTHHEAARTLHGQGVNVFPAHADGTKAPFSTWKNHQTTRATLDQIDNWYRNDPTIGVGMICGQANGNIIMLEIEGRVADRLGDITDIVTASGLHELWARINMGWVEKSPSGGWHWMLRITNPPRSGKVAQRPPNSEELAEDPKRKAITLAEIKGEGGYTILAPTGGTVHPTGHAWTTTVGSPATAAVVSHDELDQLRLVFRAVLDETPERVTAPALDEKWRQAAPNSEGDVRPGDDFEQRVDWADTELLGGAGWTLVRGNGRARYWRRPGKTIGISATTGMADDRDRLYVFSSSTEFDIETPYTKFGAYAHIHHGGDYGAAAKALVAKGYGHRAERHLKLVENAPTPAQAKPAAQPESDGATALAPKPDIVPAPAIARTLTDDGNALLLVDEHQHAIRYVPRHGKWLAWTGQRWQWDEAGHVIELARDTFRRLDTSDKDLAKHRDQSLKRSSISAAVGLAASDPRVVVDADDLDSHPLHLCTPGGTVNLRTGHIAPADPTDLHTRMAAVTPDRDCPTPLWDKFIRQTFNGDETVIGFVQRLLGYSITGIVTEHVLPFLHGGGGNGKSVLTNVTRRIAGEYASTAAGNFLMAGPERHPQEIARLAGLRYIVASEVNQHQKFDEAKVKLLTGGDALSARFMHQNEFTFEPTHKLWLSGNHQPTVDAGGDSFWRRACLIGFTYTVQKEDIIDDLDEILIRDEGPGILAWMVDGAIAMIRGGLNVPDSVRVATAEYAAEEDHLGQFIEDCLRVGGGEHVKVDTTIVYASYVAWCRDQGADPLQANPFARQVRSRLKLPALQKSSGRRFYVGLSVLGGGLLSPTVEPSERGDHPWS